MCVYVCVVYTVGGEVKMYFHYEFSPQLSFEHAVQNCTNPLPLQDNIEAELITLNNAKAVSKPGNKPPQVVVTDFSNPMGSLPHTYESLRGRNLWLSSKDAYLVEADSVEDIAGNCVDSSVTEGHAYAILETNGAATLGHQGHARAKAGADASVQPQMSEPMGATYPDLLNEPLSNDKLERPTKHTAENAHKESEGSGTSPSSAQQELGTGESLIDAPTEESLGYDSLKPHQHLAELRKDVKTSSEGGNNPSEGEGEEGSASSIGNSE